MSASRQSLLGLNAVNFFLAEVVGVILPFLNAFLKEHRWSYSSIGVATACAGFGTLVFQTPAGILSDRIQNKRALLGCASLGLGACYALIPMLAHFSPALLDGTLFISGIAGAFFVPLLAALALSLVGYTNFDHTMGVNQSWNHAGNLTAALVALLLVKELGIASLFYVMAVVSSLAVASLTLIRRDEFDSNITHSKDQALHLGSLFKDRRIRFLLIAVALFHFANAPVMPLVGLYLKHLGGGDGQIAWVVLIAQVVMIPVALLAGKYCQNWGRKPVFAVAFIVLPLRIILYSLTKDPTLLLVIQALDGIGAGIYGVVIALICGDLTRGKQGFNSLMGLCQTALAAGGVMGPLVQGYIVEYMGFKAAFICFALIATTGALIFFARVPETNPDIVSTS